MDEINASLDSGQPLVIEIDQSPSPGLQNHWVVLYARQGNDYLMLDPWPQPPDNAPTTLVQPLRLWPPSERIHHRGGLVRYRRQPCANSSA